MADMTEHEAQHKTLAASAISFDESQTGQFAVVPDDFSIKSLEAYQQKPNRHNTDYRFMSPDSLVAYINKFGTPETMVCADYDAARIGVVIDGDSIEEPSHKTHKARFEAKIADKLQAWLSACGRPLTQVSFGLFLESRAVDVVVPDAADVMEMVMKFDATRKVTFKSSARLHDGSRQFHYTEENEQRGGVTLPDHFIILTPVYRGMEPQEVKFMVRYKIDEGKLQFSIELHDKDEVLRLAFDRCIGAVKVGLKDDHTIYTVG